MDARGASSSNRTGPRSPAGVRHGLTLGGPIAMVIPNRVWEDWSEVMQVEPYEGEPKKVTRLRPGHADLAGTMKYGFDDVRNVLERASARETAARVAAGAVCRRFLEEFGMRYTFAHRLNSRMSPR